MTKVTVEPGILAHGEPWPPGDGAEGWEGGAAFLISPADTPHALEAIRAAAERFYRIDEFGRELTDAELDANGNALTPNYVGAFRTKRGIVVLPDTKGELPKLQGETMVEVLVQELESHDVEAYISYPDSDEVEQPLDLG